MLAGRKPKIDLSSSPLACQRGQGGAVIWLVWDMELIQDCRVEGSRSGFWLTLPPVDMWMAIDPNVDQVR